MKRFYCCNYWVALLLFALSFQGYGQTNDTTNLIIIYADDLGWSDISVNGGETPTPNIDRLFTEGVRLDNYTTHAVCSPSRAGLLTGRHYLNVRHSGVYTDGELSTEEVTLSAAFQAAGFATGAFGKWHNGESPTDGSAPGPHVNEYGFDRFVGYYGGGPDHFTRETGSGDKYFWFHDQEHRPDEVGFTSDLIDQYALEFLEANKSNRFFCYVAEQMVHSPYQAKYEDYVNTPESVRNGLTLYSESVYNDYMANDNLPSSHRPIVYSAMIATLDRSVGLILQWLEDNDLTENTMVVFLSDNGANENGSNLPFRDGKHSVYEGGIHVPGALYWPNGGLTGGHVYNGDFNYLDVTPTLCTLFDVPFNPATPVDGRDLSVDILDKTDNPSQVQNWVNVEFGATRIDGWKLLYNHDDMRLYDLVNDVDESNNLATSNPDKLEEMKTQHEEWLDHHEFFPNYRPPVAYSDHQPAPEGDVLEFFAVQTGTVSDYASGMEFRFARGPGEPSLSPGLGGDVIEFDIYVAPDGRNEGFYISPMRNSNVIEIQAYKTGFDQYGRLQRAGPGVQEGTCTWEHRVIGVGNNGPVGVRWTSVALAGREPGTYHFYIDNLVLRKSDGTVVPIWTDNSHFRSDWNSDLMMTPGHAAFGEVDLRVVDIEAIDSSNSGLELSVETGNTACDLVVSAVAGATALEGDYSWFVNDELVSTEGSMLSGDLFTEGDLVRCQVIGNFGCDQTITDTLESEIIIEIADFEFAIYHEETVVESGTSLILEVEDTLSYSLKPAIEPHLWLDAFRVADEQPDDGDVVMNWYDRTDQSKSAYVENPDLAPLFDPEGFNGLPALIFGENGGSVLKLFDVGEDDFFDEDWTIFLVGEIQEHDDWTNTIGNKFVTDGAGWFFRYSNAGKTALAAGSNVTQGNTYGFPWSSVSTISKTGASISLHTNGQLEMSSTIAGGETFTNSSAIYLGQKDFSTGQGRYHEGPISELIVFDRQLSIEERMYVEGYLAHKWKLNSSLPMDHAYKSFSPIAVTMKTPDGEQQLSVSDLDADIILDETTDFGDYQFFRTGCSEVLIEFNVSFPNQPPLWLSDTVHLESAIEAISYENMIATGIDIEDEGYISFNKVSGPEWLSLDESGTLAGTPTITDVGENSWIVRATDTGELSSESVLTILVMENGRPVWSADTIVIKEAITDVLYQVNISGEAIDQESFELAYEKTEGPEWVTLSPGGLISGTPKVEDLGANHVVIKAMDEAGKEAEAVFEILVDIPNEAPVWVSDLIELSEAQVNELYEFQIETDVHVTDANGDELIFELIESSNEWIAMSATGMISGTPLALDVGVTAILVEVKDSDGRSAESVLTINVRDEVLSSLKYSKDIYVYPNPVHDVLTLQINAVEKLGKYEIVDLTGRPVMKGDLEDSQTIEVERLPSGVYLLKFGEHVSRFIKE